MILKFKLPKAIYAMHPSIKRKDNLKKGSTLFLSALFLLGNNEAKAFDFVNDMPLSHLFLAAIALSSSTAFAFLLTRYFKMKSRLTAENAALYEEMIEANQKTLHAEKLLKSDAQVRMVFDTPHSQPRILGDVNSQFSNLAPANLSNFSSWLEPNFIADLEEKTAQLLKNGERFMVEAKTQRDGFMEIEGMASGSSAIIHIRPPSSLKEALLGKNALLDENKQALEQIELFLNTLPHPVWLRDEVGKLKFVNQAFAKAVETPQAADVILNNVDLLDAQVRAEISQKRVANMAFSGSVKAVSQGARKVYDVMEKPFTWGAGGVAVDITESVKIKHERECELDSQRKVFDELGTAVASFDQERRLTFYNNAYLSLFSLDVAFLESHPTDSEILDILKDKRKLPEESNYRVWKKAFLEGYTSASLDPVEELWYLPDRSSLRVVKIPREQGGVTYLFEDLTQKYDLEMKYSALNRIQKETIENLTESVAVFSANGRLSLFNEPFADMWELSLDLLKINPHFDQINEWCLAQVKDVSFLALLRSKIVGLDEVREPSSFKLELINNTIYDVDTMPLPDGGILITFHNITETVMNERLLLERNKALVEADELKTNFVELISYAFRTPLTTIVGYTSLVEMQKADLSPVMQRYLANITAGAEELDVTINAMVDYGNLAAKRVELHKKSLEIKPFITKLAASLQSLKSEIGVSVGLEASSDVTMIYADEGRMLQVLLQLLSNAVGFSHAKGKVLIKFWQDENRSHIRVSDNGIGMDEDLLKNIFKPFKNETAGTKHRGLGLGLAISKAVIELHHGEISLHSIKGEGTKVTLSLPRG